jgi:regulator of sigma E protease
MVLLAISAFLFFVFFHELGHFLAAKYFKKPVLALSLGLGPVLYKRRFGETVYKISVIPLGGYVRFYKDLTVEDTEPKGALLSFLFSETKEERELEQYLKTKEGKKIDLTPLQEIVVLLSGPFANFLLVLAPLFFLFYTLPVSELRGPAPIKIYEGSPVKEAGLKEGDIIHAINGEMLRPALKLRKVLDASLDSGAPYQLEYRRGEKQLSAEVVPKKVVNKHSVDRPFLYHLGLSLDLPVRYRGVSETVFSTFDAVIFITVRPLLYLLGIAEVPKDLKGKESHLSLGVGAAVSYMSVNAERGLQDFLMACIAMNLMLLLFNLLPIPALDGGLVVMTVVHNIWPELLTAERARAVNIVCLSGLLLICAFAVFGELAFISADLI